MKAKQFACLTACMLFASMLPMLPAQAADADGENSALTDPLFGTLPD